ncbi:hypothetical protein OC861_005519 [Tilletia horrida]|nr:hypothetical protein OC861_005519 [Tilletia horrida]
MKDAVSDANFPRDKEGRTFHVETRPARARRIAKYFDGGKPIFEKNSSRLFLTLTGTYKGVPLTIVAIGMGFSAVDFFLRECRAVTHGEMIVVRLGSCGAIDDNLHIGTVVVPSASLGVSRNWDYFNMNLPDEQRFAAGRSPYIITQPLACDQEVHDTLLEVLENSRSPAQPDAFGGEQAKVVGNILNGSGDSFYSAQGRQDAAFHDENETLLEDLKKQRPGFATFEMETYILNSLAASANANGSGRIRAGAVQMIFADRTSKAMIQPVEVALLEEWAGKGVFEALIRLPIAEEQTQKEGVWSQA